MDFASVLQKFGPGQYVFVPELNGRNIDAEFGQLAVIAAARGTLGTWFTKQDGYTARPGAAVSLAIAVIAFFWVLERASLVGTDGFFWSSVAAIAEGEMPLLPTTSISIVIVAAASVVGLLCRALRHLSRLVTSFAGFIGGTATCTGGGYANLPGIVGLWARALRAVRNLRPGSSRPQEA